jgi:hypothetical protein
MIYSQIQERFRRGQFAAMAASSNFRFSVQASPGQQGRLSFDTFAFRRQLKKSPGRVSVVARNFHVWPSNLTRKPGFLVILILRIVHHFNRFSFLQH